MSYLDCNNEGESIKASWKIVKGAYVPAITVCTDKLFLVRDKNTKIKPVAEPTVEIDTENGDATIAVTLTLTNNDTNADKFFVYRNTENSFKTAELIVVLSSDATEYSEELELIDGGYFYFVLAVNTITYVKSSSARVQTDTSELVQLQDLSISSNGGSFTNNQSVTITSLDSGVTIRYTTNGTTPTSSSTLYSGAINIGTSGTVLKARAFKSGYLDSNVATTNQFNFSVSNVTASEASGEYNQALSVTITSSTSGASIYYTLDGTTPDANSTLYTGAIDIDSGGETILKAIGIKSGYSSSAVATYTYTLTVLQLILFIGESNSGGYAVNSDATTAELAARPEVQILNNDTFVFEDLDIGTNNLIGHSGLTPNASHGFELGLANEIEDGNWPGHDSAAPVYLVKAGQGGSTISQWGINDSYFTTFATRIATAIELLNGMNPYQINVLIWVSFGINDAISNTNVNTWKQGVSDWFDNIRGEFTFQSNPPILMTKLMSNYTTYNTAIDELTTSLTNVYSISQTGTSLRDANHWDYAGMKLLANRFVSQSVSLTTNVIGGIRLGGVATESITGNEVTLTDFFSWSNLVNTSYDSGTGVVSANGTASVGTSGAVADQSIDNGQDWIIEFDHPSRTATEAVVLVLDSDNTANYGWSGANTFLTGMYHAPGEDGLNVCTNGGAFTSVGTSLTYPGKIRLTKSGNDVVYSISSDGLSFSDFYTHTGVLSGITAIYIKLFFVVPGASQETTIMYGGTLLSQDIVASGGIACGGTSDPTGYNGSFTTLAWGNRTGTSDTGGYLTADNSSTPMGGMATTSIDATSPFEVQFTFDDQSSSNAIVCYIDDDNTVDYVWTAGLQFISGVYQFGGNVYVPEGGYAATSGGSISAFPARLRMQKSGNNILIMLSNNGGAFSTIATHTNALAGKSTIYVKVLFAAPSTGQKVKGELRTS